MATVKKSKKGIEITPAGKSFAIKSEQNSGFSRIEKTLPSTMLNQRLSGIGSDFRTAAGESRLTPALRTKIEKDQEYPDRIYYNISMVNNTLMSKPALFNANLPASILDDPSSYFVSIVRFNMDGSSLPIFIFPDPSVTPLWIVLNVGGTDYPEQLVYGFANPEPSPGYGNVVYSYTSFMQMINFALNAAWVAAGQTTGTGPYFLYEPYTGHISLYAPSSFVIGGANTIFMNSPLYYYFDNFYSLFFSEGAANHKDIQILVDDLHGSNSTPIDPTVPSGFFKMTSETQALYRIQDLATIYFTSNHIPVRKEYITGVNTTTDLFEAGSSGLGAPQSNYLTDFIPIDNDTNLIRSDLTYIPSGEYRLTDLLDAANGLNTLDMQVFWTDKQNRAYSYLIPPQQSLTMKLLFIKKSSYLTKGQRNLNPE